MPSLDRKGLRRLGTEILEELNQLLHLCCPSHLQLHKATHSEGPCFAVDQGTEHFDVDTPLQH